jgi:hypothetical protein
MSEAVKRNCPWGYSCAKKWDDLLGTSDEDIRFCTACESEVYWVADRKKLAEYVLLNRCVSFRSTLITGRGEDDAEGTIELIETGLPILDDLPVIDDDNDR